MSWTEERREKQRELAAKLVSEGKFGGAGRGQGRKSGSNSRKLIFESKVRALLKNTPNLPTHSYLSSLRNGANSRGIEFCISYEDILDQFHLQEGKCFYSKIPLNFGVKDGFTTPSVDRIDSSKPYEKDNIVWCLSFLNMAKGDKSVQEFKKLISDFVIDYCSNICEDGAV